MTEALPTEASTHLSERSKHRWLVLLLVLYGLGLFVWAGSRLGAAVGEQPRFIGGTRVDGVQLSLRTLDQGGPPLLGCPTGYTPQTARTTCHPVGWTDDQGLYLFMPYVAHVTGIRDPARLMEIFFVAAFGLLIAVYPLIWWALLDSLLAGLLLPVAIAFKWSFAVNMDIYWVSAWCLLLCLPLLLLVHDRWSTRSPFALAGIVVIASVASSVRSHAGLPIFVGALVILILRRSSWPRMLTWAAVVLLAYLCVHPVAFHAIRKYRDHVIGDASMSVRYPTTHAVWHSIYIGLGHLPNRYGITWNDAVAAGTVARLNPQAAYLSPEYERTLRDEYFRIAREDPWFVVHNVTSKLEAIVDEAAARFGFLVLVIPVAMFVGSGTRTMRRHLSIVAPALPLAAIPPLLTIPAASYQIGWLGACAVVWLLAAGWMLTVVPGDVLRRLKAVRLTTLADAGSVAKNHGASRFTWVVVVLFLGVGVVAVESRIRAAGDVFYRQAAHAVMTSAPSAVAVASWPFGRGMPGDWESISATRLQPFPEGLRVTTNSARFEYQIAGPPLTMGPGRYEARLRGVVEAGGLDLGVLNLDVDRWIATTHYWSGQSGFDTGVMVTPFSIEAPTRLRVVLSNWNKRRAASDWTIRLVELYRLP